MKDTETIDRLFLELSQFTTETTGKELRLQALLTAVLDAGRPHSHLCECERCLAFDAVRKELRGE